MRNPEEFIAWWDGYIEALKISETEFDSIPINEFIEQLEMLRNWVLDQKKSNNKLNYRISSSGPN